MNEKLANIWRRIISNNEKSWVLFENGTCVILVEPEADLAEQAIGLMKEWGAVAIGASAGDFSTITLADDFGWAVTCHHNDILTYVYPEEAGEDPSDLSVGLLGRSKRDQDATELNIIHIEDNRM